MPVADVGMYVCTVLRVVRAVVCCSVAIIPTHSGQAFIRQMWDFSECVIVIERSKPEVSEHNQKEEEMKGFDPCLLLTCEWWCRDQKQRTDGCSDGGAKGLCAAFDQFMSECRKVTGHIKGLFGQHDELSQEIQAKIAERQELILKVVSVTTSRW